MAAQTSGLVPHVSTSTPPRHTTATSPISTLTPQARKIFQESFDKFQQTVQKLSPSDQREFNDTTLRDVRKAAREIEQLLAARQCLRNMQRLEPLLNGLEAYAAVVEVLCNGTPYLAWIWTPIKLMMKLATDHISAFEKLMAAYAQIADSLPRFDRLNSAFQNNSDFQQVLAVVYSDIIEFHRKAYEFFRRSGWKCFFRSSWGQFDKRFKCILANLRTHIDLVDREVNAHLISETMKWRREATAVAEKEEKERAVTQLVATLDWLGVDKIPYCGQSYQENTLDKLIRECCPGTTDWLIKNKAMKGWLQNRRGQSVLWLKGKPGSGKSMLCAKIAQFLLSDGQSTVLFCFYSYRISCVHPDPTIFILATLIAQILRRNTDLSVYVHEEFVAEARPASISNLKEIIMNLIPQLKMPRILIDGIDECVRYDTHGNPSDLTLVRDVLQDVLQLETLAGGNLPLKLLIVSRDIKQIVGKLSKKPTISLDDEVDAMTSAIRRFTNQRLQEIRERFEEFQEIDSILLEVEEKIVLKAQGMFLWVRLILAHLEEDAYNLDDLEAAVMNMPVTLNEFYSRIVARIQALNDSSRERAMIILNWLVCSRRPLRQTELQDAIVFAGNMKMTQRSKLPTTVLDLCKPLIQIHDDRTVTFVHFTIQEYLINNSSQTLFEAERCAAMTCLNYLDFSLNLIDTRTSEGTRTADVGNTLHTLQPYVHDNWLDHLLAFASNLSLGQDSQFERYLARLVESVRLHQTIGVCRTTCSGSEDTNLSIAIEPRLEHLRHNKPVFEMLSHLVQHRHHRNLYFHATAPIPTPPDPTPFNAVQIQYEKMVVALLTCVSFPGVTPAQLIHFKTLHEHLAYVCRYPGCSSILPGFATNDARIQHERTHAPAIVCTYPGCKYKLSFGSMQSLKGHVRKFHSATPNIPRSIRSKQISTVNQKATAPGSFTAKLTPTDLLPIQYSVEGDLNAFIKPTHSSALLLDAFQHSQTTSLPLGADELALQRLAMPNTAQSIQQVQQRKYQQQIRLQVRQGFQQLATLQQEKLQQKQQQQQPRASMSP
ncbi:hypothetical protein P153DRAFT_356631 [Dothidotthia symphoricarpi CBS 119687]|uniref:NACHT domain-containing protein n=1 Tax=Dothidotthia symphoricarpi CBS 119687 TaxID=1392245 RepID=A0A6A6AGA5_9PLEO|nr:uncharacterized protein P153DRAFT_356631 [Dothidotthia symphoricarpi CBS 119687]KAF2129964.1 hypothetical protein P153DRAFT_356631 [Dothidotthia symphoricarpi CBS 119687]